MKRWIEYKKIKHNLDKCAGVLIVAAPIVIAEIVAIEFKNNFNVLAYQYDSKNGRYELWGSLQK